MDEPNSRTANETSRGGIDQLNKGGTESPNQTDTGINSRGGIDQLNKGIYPEQERKRSD